MISGKRAFAGSGYAGGKKQEGAVLIISLIMLVALTIGVMAMVNLSSSQFQVINNMGQQKALEAAAREGIEIAMNQQELFSKKVMAGTSEPPPAWADAGVGNLDYVTGGEILVDPALTRGYEVTVNIPFCYGSRTAPGYSALSAVAPEDTHWEVTARAVNRSNGAMAEVVEGVKIRLGAGNCGATL